MKIKEPKTQSLSNGKLPYEKPVLHVLSGTPATSGKAQQSTTEFTFYSISANPS